MFSKNGRLKMIQRSWRCCSIELWYGGGNFSFFFLANDALLHFSCGSESCSYSSFTNQPRGFGQFWRSLSCHRDRLHVPNLESDGAHGEITDDLPSWPPPHKGFLLAPLQTTDMSKVDLLTKHKWQNTFALPAGHLSHQEVEGTVVPTRLPNSRL